MNDLIAVAFLTFTTFIAVYVMYCVKDGFLLGAILSLLMTLIVGVAFYV